MKKFKGTPPFTPRRSVRIAAKAERAARIAARVERAAGKRKSANISEPSPFSLMSRPPALPVEPSSHADLPVEPSSHTAPASSEEQCRRPEQKGGRNIKTPRAEANRSLLVLVSITKRGEVPPKVSDGRTGTELNLRTTLRPIVDFILATLNNLNFKALSTSSELTSPPKPDKQISGLDGEMPELNRRMTELSEQLKAINGCLESMNHLYRKLHAVLDKVDKEQAIGPESVSVLDELMKNSTR